MIAELQMVFQQLVETYDAFLEMLGILSDEAVCWRPVDGARNVCDQVQHSAYANKIYCSYLVGAPERVPETDLRSTNECIERLGRSLDEVKAVFETASLDDLVAVRDQDWRPLGSLVTGPLNGLWFAHQIVRHSAYHLGQANLICQLQGLQIGE